MRKSGFASQLALYCGSKRRLGSVWDALSTNKALVRFQPCRTESRASPKPHECTCLRHVCWYRPARHIYGHGNCHLYRATRFCLKCYVTAIFGHDLDTKRIVHGGALFGDSTTGFWVRPSDLNISRYSCGLVPTWINVLLTEYDPTTISH